MSYKSHFRRALEADPELQVLAAYAVDELFLVAVTVASVRAAIQAS